MPLRTLTPRRATVAVAALGLVVTLGACDSDGSSRSEGTSSTTGKHRPSTTSTTRPNDGGTTTTTSPAGPGTTLPTVAPPTAPPATGTCGGQTAAIAAVVNGGDLTPVPIDSYTITDCRLAPSQPIWAAVTMTPKPGQPVGRLTVVVERLGSIWTVHSYGAGTTGCDAPAPVPAELQLGC